MFWGYRVPRFPKNIEKVSATSAIRRITYNMSHFFQSVRPLTMTTEDGKPYTRSPEVEAQIAETLHWSGADLLGKHKSLLNETLVYHVRRFRERDEHLCGVLLHELAQRTTRTVKAAMHGIDRLAKADIAMQVEMEVLQQHFKIPIVPLLRFTTVFIPMWAKNWRSSISQFVAPSGSLFEVRVDRP